ncbi:MULTISPECIES: hypothetical protein [unclassified Francisella]|uniref:hypothetical protein n=1 Tax=unclassified Francisella TaxID=2610885 RepID=UPI002E311E5A|nr:MULTISPECIES: hypothetical protein [unclassified Francisella]MED7818584.1 hypothetical protein [Francisella sp. 19S2-4]MED7829420.1 hypothetical protein [Francisella sp. 19S2-10]
MQRVKKISLLSIVSLITLISFSNANQIGSYSLSINKPSNAVNNKYDYLSNMGDIQSRLKELN